MSNNQNYQILGHKIECEYYSYELQTFIYVTFFLLGFIVCKLFSKLLNKSNKSITNTNLNYITKDNNLNLSNTELVIEELKKQDEEFFFQ